VAANALCPKGHEVEPEDRFCGVCGANTIEGPPGIESSLASSLSPQDGEVELAVDSASWSDQSSAEDHSPNLAAGRFLIPGSWTLNRGIEWLLGLWTVLFVFSAFVFYPNIFFYVPLVAVPTLCIFKVGRIDKGALVAFFGAAVGASILEILIYGLVNTAFGYAPDWSPGWWIMGRLGCVSIGLGALLIAIPERRHAVEAWVRGGTDWKLFARAGLVCLITLLSLFTLWRTFQGSWHFGVITPYGSSSPYLPPTNENVSRLVENDWDQTWSSNGEPGVDWSQISMNVEPISDQDWANTPADDKNRSHWFDVTFQLNGANYVKEADPWSQEVYDGTSSITVSP